jgi:hypothetical protein
MVVKVVEVAEVAITVVVVVHGAGQAEEADIRHHP